jgi:hypothetical protein
MMKKNKLHNIKSTGFKTPDNYFESFEARLQERLIKKEIIEGIESTGYSVPKGYFETFENNLVDKLKHDKSVIALKPRRKLYYIAGIAASFILLFSLFYNTEDGLSIDTIDTVAIESYLYQEDYTSDEFA